MFTVTKFNHRGKAVISLEGQMVSMLKMWALQNTKGKATSIVMNDDTKEIVLVVQGNGKDYPTVIKDKAEIAAMGIEVV